MTEISRTISTAANSPIKVSVRQSSGANTPNKTSAKVSAANYSSVPRPSTAAYFQVDLASLSPKKQPSIQQQIQQRIPNKRDLAILHESKIFRSLLDSAAKKKEEQSPKKRDPIKQDNGEEIHVFKPCFKRVENVEYNSKSADENVARSKKVGEFNERYNPRPEEPKPQGIKAFVVNPPESRDENPKRQLKAVRTKSVERYRNPLTEGDLEGSIIKRAKKTPEKNDHHQRINDKRYLLPAERGCSPQGKIFRDKTVTIVGTDHAAIKPHSARLRSLPARPVSAQEEKMRGFIKGVLEYHDGPNFRDQGVSEKCNMIRFSDILKGQVPVEERVFARKKTIEY